MKSLRTLSVLVVLLGGGALPAAAQTASPEALKAAQELASLTSKQIIAQVTTTLTNEVWPSIEAAMKVKNPKIDARTLAMLRKEFESAQVAAVGEIMNDSAAIYAKLFTADELRQIIAFYRTPVGTKSLTLMPRASIELMREIVPRMQKVSDTVNSKFAEILKQRGFNP
jgi:hypothetical protein